MNFLLMQGHTGTAKPCVLLCVLCMMPLVLKYTEPTLFLSGTFYFEWEHCDVSHVKKPLAVNITKVYYYQVIIHSRTRRAETCSSS